MAAHKKACHECLFRATCDGSCKIISRHLGWRQFVPMHVCGTCMKYGGPLDERSIDVRQAFEQRMIKGLSGAIRYQLPEVVGFLLAWHLSNEDYLREEPNWLSKFPPEFFARVRESRGLPPA